MDSGGKETSVDPEKNGRIGDGTDCKPNPWEQKRNKIKTNEMKWKYDNEKRVNLGRGERARVRGGREQRREPVRKRERINHNENGMDLKATYRNGYIHRTIRLHCSRTAYLQYLCVYKLLKINRCVTFHELITR